MDRYAIIEGLKELVRLAILGAITAALAYLGGVVELFEPTSLQFIIGTAVLRALDRTIHKSDIKLNGISPV